MSDTILGKPKTLGFFQKHKKSVSAAVATVIIGGLLPTSIWFHNAWGDDRYVLKIEDLRTSIRQIDNALFEIDQEVSFATDDRDRAKWKARQSYYLREKQQLREELLERTSNGS